MAKGLIVPQERKALVAGPINKTPVNKDSIEGMNRETDRKVGGEFVNIEAPGQPAKVCGKYYKEMNYFEKVFNDGEKCVIPLSVARFINERCFYNKHGYILDAQGNSIKEEKATPRYKFIIEERL
jgi:hypothetical protein